MKNQKLAVIAIVVIIYFSFYGLATVGGISHTFEEEKLSYFGDDDIGDIIPEWILEGNLPLVPAIIIFSGLLLFIIFALDLYRKKRKMY